MTAKAEESVDIDKITNNSKKTDNTLFYVLLPVQICYINTI